MGYILTFSHVIAIINLLWAYIMFASHHRYGIPFYGIPFYGNPFYGMSSCGMPSYGICILWSMLPKHLPAIALSSICLPKLTQIQNRLWKIVWYYFALNMLFFSIPSKMYNCIPILAKWNDTMLLASIIHQPPCHLLLFYILDYILSNIQPITIYTDHNMKQRESWSFFLCFSL